jgi:fructose-1,6-bisphosphatase II / sedoheptulose-1,7-bisphosphatase
MQQTLANIALDATIKAAIASYDMIGRLNAHTADQVAVDAMRNSLNASSISGTVVIGEGERDQAPMLYIGEHLGKGGTAIDIAVDPLEGTALCASGAYNAITTVALAPRGTILMAPDVYMQKIATCIPMTDHVLDLDLSPAENVTNMAKFLNMSIKDIGVTVLDRPRHKEIIESLRSVNARVFLITDGDIAAILRTRDSGMTHLYMGIGGAPEGVIAAAAIKAIGGFMQARLKSDNPEQIARAKEKMMIQDFDKKLAINDLIKADAIFCATGVTDGYLQGVKYKDGMFHTHSIITDSSDLSCSLISRIAPK